MHEEEPHAEANAEAGTLNPRVITFVPTSRVIGRHADAAM